MMKLSHYSLYLMLLMVLSGCSFMDDNTGDVLSTDPQNVSAKEMPNMMKFETGILEAIDKNKKPIIFEGSPVILEWYKTTDYTTMVELQKKALTVIAESFADEVRTFLFDEKLQLRKEYAEMSQSDSVDENPFIASGRLDRKKRVEFSYHQWEEWFAVTAKAIDARPITYFFIMAKNDKGDVLGVVAFYSSPELPQFFPEFSEYTSGDVVLEPIAITPAAQGYGLARSLIFSILTLAPEAKRILVGTRIWITNAVASYKKLGFTEYKREGIGVYFQYLIKSCKRAK